METLLPESAGKQMEWNGNHYKLLQIVQKTFADLFVYSDANSGVRAWACSSHDDQRKWLFAPRSDPQ